MAAKQNLFLAVFIIVTVSLVSISSSNARGTKSFGKLTRREAVASEISFAPAPSSTAEDGGYGLYSSSSEEDSETRYDDDVSEQTPRYETRYDDVSEQTPRYETRYDVDPSQQTDINDNYNSQYSDDSDTNSFSYNDDDKQQQQGLSDTRFLDNDNSYYDNNNNNDNDNNDHNDLGEAQRYEFDSMEEYQKYQEAHPYLP